MKDLETKGFFINSKGENSKDLSKKKQIDESSIKPKKPLSSFFFFAISNSKILKAKNSELKIPEVAKLNGEAWQKMTQDEKTKFFDMAQQDIVRHANETKQLLNKGYFINKDGIKI